MEDLQKEYELRGIFTQPQDCCTSDNDLQELHIHTCDGGGGEFYIIETQRWAFDKPEDLLNLIHEFIEKNKKIKNI
jgi:hypothetical protein